MIPFSLTPEISVPLLCGNRQVLIATASCVIIYFFIVLNSEEESSMWDGILCQMPLMLLYPGPRRYWKVLGQHLLGVCM